MTSKLAKHFQTDEWAGTWKWNSSPWREAEWPPHLFLRKRCFSGPGARCHTWTPVWRTRSQHLRAVLLPCSRAVCSPLPLAVSCPLLVVSPAPPGTSPAEEAVALLFLPGSLLPHLPPYPACSSIVTVFSHLQGILALCGLQD